MFVRIKSNKSGSKSVQVIEKKKGKTRVIQTIGCTSDEIKIQQFVNEGKLWILNKNKQRNPELDLYGEERVNQEREIVETENFISNIDNILLNGVDLVLDKVFDCVGFNRIEDNIFRGSNFSITRIPSSK